MKHDIPIGAIMCVKGHIFRDEQLKVSDFTASHKRGWCPISSCRMPLRRVALVDRKGNAWTDPLV